MLSRLPIQLPSPKERRALRLAYARGASWNWVYWYWCVGTRPATVLVASVPQRFIQLIESGNLTVDQVAQTLAVRTAGRLAASAPWVESWRIAIVALLRLRIDARQAALLGEVAYHFALEGRWELAWKPALEATLIEEKHAGRVQCWRPLLYRIALALVRLGHVDPQVRSVAEASPRTSRTRHERRWWDQRR